MGRSTPSVSASPERCLEVVPGRRPCAGAPLRRLLSLTVMCYRLCMFSDSDTSVEGCEGRGKAIFREYMNKVTGELHALISAGMATFPAGGDTVAVFGHAVFLNAVAVSVAEAMGIEKADEQVADFDLGEAQGILCDASAKSVSLCKAAD
mmetsp:Transcript_29052/g.74718  ORF Transcript_29052/g.74718 Transcript_29052/m.74718 type:complete len:150 (-) Transcript_29052:302-751(-)